MDWVFGYIPLDAPETKTLVKEAVSTTGAVLSGAWSGPQFVLTHNAPKDEEDASIKFLSGDIHGAVGVARDAAGGKNVMVIGANIARQCIQGG